MDRAHPAGSRPLLIGCSDFAVPTRPHDLRMYQVLAAMRSVAEAPGIEEADLLIYSDFGEAHRRAKGLKVYLTGENMVPDFNECDLAFSPVEITGDRRAVRLPYYAQVLPLLGSLVRPEGWEPALTRQPGFCCFVASNPRGRMRNRFFKALNRRSRVDSGGRHFNNLGHAIGDKREFIGKYRFTMAFENSASPGYITEKLVEPLVAGSIPIYWGAPDVDREFNPDCMVDVSRFGEDMEAAADHVMRIDKDEAVRRRMLSTPPFRGNREPACMRAEHLAEPLTWLIDMVRRPGPRIYSPRRLRSHVYSSRMSQATESLICRLEGWLWKMGMRG